MTRDCTCPCCMLARTLALAVGRQCSDAEGTLIVDPQLLRAALARVVGGAILNETTDPTVCRDLAEHFYAQLLGWIESQQRRTCPSAPVVSAWMQ